MQIKTHPGLTGWFMWLWEALHAREVPLKIWASVRKSSLWMGLKHLAVGCCCLWAHPKYEPDASSELIAERLDFNVYSLWINLLLALSLLEHAHILRLACVCSVAICQGFQPHWSRSYLTPRKQGEMDQVPEGEEEGVCGQKASEVWCLLPDCWIICTF